VVHACGVVGLMLIAKLSTGKALLGTLAFVPGDLLKAAVCAAVVHTVARGLPDWRLGDRGAR
jgi:biotin transport system substrate-specific component